MGKVTCGMTMSLDGFVAGPNQSLENAFGEGAEGLHRWMFEEPDANAAELEAMTAADGFIMGRNMFGPGRGAWDEEWTGWGERASVSRAGIRPNPPSARSADDEGRDDLHLRD